MRRALCSHGPDPLDAFGGAAKRKQLRDITLQVNNNLEAVDAATSQNYRSLCTNDADVTARNVTLAPVGADGAHTEVDGGAS